MFIRKAITVTALALSVLGVAAMPALAFDEVPNPEGGEPLVVNPVQGDGVGTITVRIVDDELNYQVVSATNGIADGRVGYFLNFGYAWAYNSYTNLVSCDLSGFGVGDVVTCATSWWSEGIMPQGQSVNAYQVVAVNDAGLRVTVNVSSVSPHPSIADAWLTNNGFVLF